MTNRSEYEKNESIICKKKRNEIFSQQFVTICVLTNLIFMYKIKNKKNKKRRSLIGWKEGADNKINK